MYKIRKVNGKISIDLIHNNKIITSTKVIKQNDTVVIKSNNKYMIYE